MSEMKTLLLPVLQSKGHDERDEMTCGLLAGVLRRYGMPDTLFQVPLAVPHNLH